MDAADRVLTRMLQAGGWFPRSARLVALTAVVFLLFPGCALSPRGAEIGSGTIYIQGELSRPHAGGYGRVWAEALRAVKAMEWEVIRAERDSLGGTITARRQDDTLVSLQVNPTGADSTLVKVRVGTSGDWAASERIQTRISRGLRDQIEIGTGFVVRPPGRSELQHPTGVTSASLMFVAHCINPLVITARPSFSGVVTKNAIFGLSGLRRKH